MKIGELDILIQAVCPIHGISSDGRIDFKPGATPAQQAAAQAVMAANISKLVF